MVTIGNWQQWFNKHFSKFLLISLGGALHVTPGPICTLPFCLFFFHYCNYLFRETQTQGAGYFRTFWVGMCCWDHGTLSLYQS